MGEQTLQNLGLRSIVFADFDRLPGRFFIFLFKQDSNRLVMEEEGKSWFLL